MTILLDPRGFLKSGLARVRRELELPGGFPADVLAEADEAAARRPTDHRDRSEWPFVTLDPASSTDLDQAFHIEQTGGRLLLHYAIADAGWFVRPGGALEREAWKRGTTQYMPGGRAPLYPAAIGEAAASLLPDGPRPAVVFTVEIENDGRTRIAGVERSIIRSRAKLGYETVLQSDLPPLLGEVARRIRAAERTRGAARLDTPEQELTRDEKGRFTLMLRPALPAEQDNAAMSLAANLAVARLFLSHHGGLFRVLAEPDQKAVARLWTSARARGIAWDRKEDLTTLERRLDARKPHEAAFLLEIRKASRGASYAPWTEGEKPWHAAVAAAYVHATAPLRRLADRYVVESALALVRTGRWPDGVEDIFRALPPIMEEAAQTSRRLDRAVLDLAEAVLLEGREGEEFAAVVTEVEDRGADIQLLDQPVMTRIAGDGLQEAETIRVRLDRADPEKRVTHFSLAGA
jgi:exoribonuclease R